MKRISALPWTESALTVLCLVSTLGLKEVTSRALECYSCTDRGDGGCLPENAVNVTCSSGYNVCLEAISAIRTSHEDHIVLKKGCSYGDPATLDRTISFYGISIFIHLNQCNSSLCNSEMDLKDYQLATGDNVTRVPNEEQCYSCLGKDDCSPPNAPVVSCYDTYSHCFDGNVTISIDNDTTPVPVKSCTLRYRCAVQTLTHGSASFEVKGACCSGPLCNQDLSNQTQLGDIPFLVFLKENNEEPTTTAPPNPWLNPIDALPTTQGTIPTDAPISSAASQSSDSSDQPEENPTNNMACGLVFWPWLMFVLSWLS